MATDFETLNDQGFVWFRQALSRDELAQIEAHCEFGTRPGHRPAADAGLIALLSGHRGMGAHCRAILPHARPVRFVAFNKSSEANWAVPWHQDRVLAVQEKRDLPGFKNWIRQGVYWHVEPPVSMIEDMIFARIHFDETTRENGAMELALGTHKLGVIASNQAQSIAERAPTTVCDAAPGDVLFVKALTLHRSRSASKASQRRALRVDYAALDLPTPLKWAIDPPMSCG